ncbi:MAG: hypothetical protein HW406_2369 [Candidatus Brocadiaceae bacterium]|nr:hypothetical protein [Candidatus Brocadiaceae bacterium]
MRFQPKVLLRRIKRQDRENKERNVISKYLDVDFDFMHGSFWLKIILVEIDHRKYKSSSIPASV